MELSCVYDLFLITHSIALEAKNIDRAKGIQSNMKTEILVTEDIHTDGCLFAIAFGESIITAVNITSIHLCVVSYCNCSTWIWLDFVCMS